MRSDMYPFNRSFMLNDRHSRVIRILALIFFLAAIVLCARIA
jgi:hypothetical protein